MPLSSRLLRANLLERMVCECADLTSEVGTGVVKSVRVWGRECGQQRPSKAWWLSGSEVAECRTTGWLSRVSQPWYTLVVCLFIIPALAISACTKQDEAEKPHEPASQLAREVPSGGTYRRPLGNDPATLDPARMNDNYAVAVANQIFDSLVEFDAHLNIIPALAQSWSASRDGLVWTFRLRKEVKFHNGREVTAEDVVYSLSRLLDPAVGSRRIWFLEKVKGASDFRSSTTKTLDGITAVERYTVQITLSEPFAPFISILGLSHLAVVPREEVERLGSDFGSSPVGTGPFRFIRWERGKDITLEANARYFRGRPSVDRIRFVIFPGEVRSEMLQAFERGDLEETILPSDLPADKRKKLLEAGTYNVIRKPTLSLLLLGFNLEYPPFNKREVRQAFNYAIDRARINRELRADRFVVAKGFLPPGMPGYNPEVQAYSYEPDQAKALLAKAGYPDGTSLPPVTVSSSVKSAVARQDFQYIQQDMSHVGVRVELQEFEDWPTFQRALQRGEVEIFRYAWFADYPDPDSFLYPLFHSQSANNYFRYRNPEVDGLLDEARRETDDLHRVKLYREAEQLILNDAPGIMLLHYPYEGLFQPYVRGWRSTPWVIHIFP